MANFSIAKIYVSLVKTSKISINNLINYLFSNKKDINRSIIPKFIALYR